MVQSHVPIEIRSAIKDLKKVLKESNKVTKEALKRGEEFEKSCKRFYTMMSKTSCNTRNSVTEVPGSCIQNSYYCNLIHIKKI